MGVFRQAARALLVLLVLVSFAGVQTATAMEIHPDHHGGLPTVATIQLGTLALTAWHTAIEVAPYTSDDGRTFNSSRAPPV